MKRDKLTLRLDALQMNVTRMGSDLVAIRDEVANINNKVAQINEAVFRHNEPRSFGFGILLPARPGLEGKLEAVIRHLGIVDFTQTPAKEAEWVAQLRQKHGTKPGNKTSRR